jgi:hypothetical protein
MVSELLYVGRTIKEIASFTTTQTLDLVCRARDDQGRLIRAFDALPPGVKVDHRGMRVVEHRVPFTHTFRQVLLNQGVPEEEIEKRWQEFVAANPDMKLMGGM